MYEKGETFNHSTPQVKINGLLPVTKTFTTAGVEVSYSFELTTTLPDLEQGSVGDVCEIANAPARVMVKHGDGWKEFAPTDQIPFPHPNPYRRLKIKYEFDMRKKAWRDYRSVQTRKDAGTRNHNAWVDRLASQWRTSAPSCHATFQTGHAILDALARHPTRIPYFKLSETNSDSLLPKDSLVQLLPFPVSTIKPSTALVFNDLEPADLTSLLIINAITGIPTKVSGKAVLHYCFAKVGDQYRPGDSPLLKISNIPATGLGLGRCRMQSPLDHNFTGVFERNSTSDNYTPSWNSYITAGSSIIPPHCDGYGRSQVVYHFEGQKLCFVWPPTPHNLDAMLEQYQRPNRDAVLGIQDALQNLEGLQLYFLDRPAIYTMPCHAIHACMAFTLCSGASFGFWTMSSFPDAQRVIASYLQLTDTPVSNRLPETHQFFACFLNEIVDSELNPWLDLALKYPNTAQGSAIEQWVKNTTLVITDLKSMYNSFT
ncbi:hypothetical protein V5O48_005222 [Marasmius crinis-equi]|uniref:JmjC domain-containing protein n=1 Tax=Marasmius crinis-equi TaxID=585013 RepID=A0ABR3FNU7_9AGAR